MGPISSLTSSINFDRLYSNWVRVGRRKITRKTSEITLPPSFIFPGFVWRPCWRLLGDGGGKFFSKNRGREKSLAQWPRNHLLFFIFAFFCALPSPVQSQPVGSPREGVPNDVALECSRLFDAKDYVNAMRECRKLDELGDINATFLVVSMLWHGWGLAVNREEAIEKVRKIATAPAPLPGEIDLVSKAVELLPEMEAELAKNASSVTKHKDLSTESIKDSPTDVTAIIAPTSDVSIKGEEKKVSSSTQPARTSIKLYDHLTAGEKATFFGSVSVLFLFGIALLYAHKKEQVCTECGTKLPSDVSYCIECGTRIDNQVFESNNMRIGGSCLIGLPILMILALLLTDYALVAVSAMVSCPLPPASE